MIRKKYATPSGLWMNDIPVYNPVTPSGFMNYQTTKLSNYYNPVTPSGFMNYQTTKLSNYLTLARFPNLLKSRYCRRTCQTRRAASAWILKDIFDFPQQRSAK